MITNFEEIDADIAEFIQSFDDSLGMRGKSMSLTKDQRLSNKSQQMTRLKEYRNAVKEKKSSKQGSLVAANAPPIHSSNFGYIMLQEMGWNGGSLNQATQNERVYSTPDGRALTEPLPAYIKIGKKGVGY